MKIIYLAAYLFLLSSLVSCSYLGDKSILPALQNELTETPEFISLRSVSRIPLKGGLVFYPGGLIDPHVFLVWMDSLVQERPDLLIIIPKMPSNLAVFSPDKGIRICSKFPEVPLWLIGGHSLGGTMACKSIKNGGGQFAGLLLLGAYADDKDDLSASPIKVLSISASNDGLSTPQDIQDNSRYLPAFYAMQDLTDFPQFVDGRTYSYEIAGGNHAQFGSYGPQKKRRHCSDFTRIATQPNCNTH